VINSTHRNEGEGEWSLVADERNRELKIERKLREGEGERTRGSCEQLRKKETVEVSCERRTAAGNRGETAAARERIFKLETQFEQIELPR
jgi:hypothetical protein